MIVLRRTHLLRMSRPAALALFAVLLPLAACSPSTPRYALTVAGVELQVEIADTPESRSRGLMHRTQLAERAGMLFVFQERDMRTFWMRDTPLPLSIAYIDDRLTIREIHDMEPHSLEPVSSRGPARYALEVNQGAFERLGIRVGDRLILSEALKRRLSR